MSHSPEGTNLTDEISAISMEEAANVVREPLSVAPPKKKRTGPSPKTIKAVAQSKTCDLCRLTFADEQVYKSHVRRSHSDSSKLSEFEALVLDNVMHTLTFYKPSKTDVETIVEVLMSRDINVKPAAVVRRFASRYKLLSEETKEKIKIWPFLDPEPSAHKAILAEAVASAVVQESGPDDCCWGRIE